MEGPLAMGRLGRWRGCRCSVTQLSDDDLERWGYEPSPTAPDDGSTRAWHNPRTGRIVQVPTGIDPGWQHNAGKVSRADTVSPPLVAEKIAAAEDDLDIPTFMRRDPTPGGVRAALTEDAVTAEEFRRRAPGYVPAEQLPGRAARYYEEDYGEINDALRADMEIPTARLRAVARDMRAAMAPLREDMTLWRGRRTDQRWRLNEEIQAKSFHSSSASWRTAARFAGDEGGLIQIRACKGTRAVVENGEEQEVLLDPGTRLRVVEIVDGARDGAHPGYTGPNRVYIMEPVEDRWD